MNIVIFMHIIYGLIQQAKYRIHFLVKGTENSVMISLISNCAMSAICPVGKKNPKRL